MSSYESGQNNQSDASPEEAHSKRRRIALACLDCRRRKLKCDRSYPACERCRKGGHASSCIYDPDAVETIAISASTEKARANGNVGNGLNEGENGTGSKPGGSPSSFVHHHALDIDESALAGLRAHIYRLENRVIGLEKIINDPQKRHGSYSVQPFVRPNKFGAPEKALSEETDQKLMLFRGKSFKTQFFGASHNTTYLSCLPGLRNFMKDMVIQHPKLAQFQREIKAEKVKEDLLDATDVAREGLVQHLPARVETDHLVGIYVDTFESTYRVLHLPSFFEEYQRSWDSPEQVRPAFVALLLSMLAATSCLRSQESKTLRGDSSLDREQAIKWSSAAKAWLQLQSNKHVTITSFQTHCIIYIAEQVNAIKRKRTWTSAGTLLRMAMAAGLHRDAEVVNLRHGSLVNRKVTLFDQEMRRRVWATIAELEFHASIERGMPAMLRDVIIDCGAPLNIDDTDIDPRMDHNRASKPISGYTRSSFLSISHATFTLRQDILSMINGPVSEMSYEDLLQYDRRINLAIDEIPSWRGDNTRLSRSLLQIQLQHLLLLIHRPFVHHESESSRYDYSAMAHFRAAVSILELHHNLLSAGIQVLSVMRNDMLDAVLGICYNFSVLDPNPGTVPNTVFPYALVDIWVLDQKLSRRNGTVGFADPLPYLENGLSMIDCKINQRGVGIQEYYCVCSVIGLHRKTSSDEASSPTEEYQAADRVARLMQQMLARQDNFSAAATLASLPNMHASSLNGVTNPNGSGSGYGLNSVPQQTQLNGTSILEDFNHGFENFDLGDMAAWDLDAFFSI